MTARTDRAAPAASGGSGLSSTLRLETWDASSVITGFAWYSFVFRVVGAIATVPAGVHWLTGIQVLGAALYALVLLRGRGVRTERFLGLLGPEWVLWGLSASVVFGTRTFLYVHSITTTTGILLLLHDLPVRRRLALFVVPLLLPVPVLILLHWGTPLVQLAPPVEEALFLVNQMVAIVFLVVVSGIAMFDHARARELAERRAEEQTRLVEDLSHELRTPIAAMLTATQGARTVRETPRPAEERLDRIGERLGWLEGSARAAGRLVERMLELAMLDRGRLPERKPGDLGESVAAVVCRLRPLAATRGQELRFRPDAVPFHSVDAASLEIVLQNLVANALAHSPKGGCVEVRLVESDDTVRLEVEDKGEGIAAEDLPRVFDRMWRADPARSRAEGRAGLGLSIADRHARLIGARLRVESQVGRGSTFSVIFDRS